MFFVHSATLRNKAPSIDGRQHVQETALRTEQVVGHGVADDHHMRLASAGG